MAVFEKPHLGKSLWQLANTVLPFLGLWTLAYVSQFWSIWLALLLTIPTAAFAVRTFIIFHDCCHGAFFNNRRANIVVGTATGLLTFFPYQQWKHEHAVHHATSSNLSRRGTGDIWTLTVKEYVESSRARKLLYRFYRNPFVLFGLGPIYLFLILYRMNNKGASRKERWNTYGTNVALVMIVSILSWALGWREFLFIEAPVLYLSGMAGIWLFYVQHQFETTYFEEERDWEFVRAAMDGSSYYKLPKVLQWLTGNIGFHHVHHLSSRIPNYHLQKVHRSHPVIKNVPSVTLLSSFRSLRYRVWDEAAKKFIGFRQIPAVKIDK